jgi:chromate reductase
MSETSAFPGFPMASACRVAIAVTVNLVSARRYMRLIDELNRGQFVLRSLSKQGVIVISPEYNHGMSGVLKNALDWASRPYGRSALGGKPVLTMTSSPAFTGGVRAQQQMNETLVSIPARLVHRAQIVIGGVHAKVRDGRLVDESALRFALAGVDDLLDEIRAARLLRAAA